MFFGDCLSSHPDAGVWFERALGEDKQWHERVFLATVKEDQLVEEEIGGESPKLMEVHDALSRVMPRASGKGRFE